MQAQISFPGWWTLPQHARQPGLFPQEHAHQRQHPSHQLRNWSPQSCLVSLHLHFSGQNDLSYRRDHGTRRPPSRLKLWVQLRQENDRRDESGLRAAVRMQVHLGGTV